MSDTKEKEIDIHVVMMYTLEKWLIAPVIVFMMCQNQCTVPKQMTYTSCTKS